MQKNPSLARASVETHKKYETAVNTYFSKYEQCNLCPRLKIERHKVCLLTGKVPFDILFVGSTPDEYENLCGIPFSDDRLNIVHELWDEVTSPLRICPNAAFTLSISCQGRTYDNYLREPSKEEMRTCQTRFTDLLQICLPKIVVLLGKHAQTLSTFVPHPVKKIITTHPLYWLSNGGKQSVDYARTLLNLKQAIRKIPRHVPKE